MHSTNPVKKKVDGSLGLQDARLRDFAAIASDWYFELDERLCITFLSENWGSFFNIPPEDCFGLRIDDLWKQLGVPEHLILEHLKSFEDRIPEIAFERSHTLPNGKTISMRLRARLYSSDTGEFEGYRGVGFDVTEEHQREVDLMRAKIDAQLANYAKTNFLANMSHELRTPLNCILGFSEVMNEELLGPIGSERYQSYIGDIHDSASHLLEMIDDILDFARIGNGQDQLEESVFKLEDLVASCLRRLADSANAVAVEIKTEFAEDLPDVKADRNHLRRILQNLVSNAIKFSAEGGTVVIGCCLRTTGDLEISVQDNGIGISEWQFEKILEPFEQVAPALSRGHEGAGIGLPVAKALIDLHGGSLTVASIHGDKTVFSCILPASRLVDPSAQSDKKEGDAAKHLPQRR